MSPENRPRITPQESPITHPLVTEIGKQPGHENSRNIIPISCARQRRERSVASDAEKLVSITPIQPATILPLPDTRTEEDRTDVSLAIKGQRNFFKNLHRENDDELTLVDKNARHPILSKNQVIRIYQAMENGQGTDSLMTQSFLQDTKKPQEREYLQEILYTTENPRDVMIASNQKLILKIMQKFKGRGLNDDELYSAGNLGLIRAVEKFEPERGFQFSTYATWWVEQALYREIADTGRVIDIPVHLHDALGKAVKIQGQVAKELGRTPTSAELQQQLTEHEDFTPRQIEFIIPELYTRKYSPKSLDQQIVNHKGDEGATIGELTPDERVNTEEEALATYEQEEIRAHIKQAYERRRLSDRERRIIELRSGVDRDEPATLQKVGEEMGISRERVRQIELQALHKLRGDTRLRQLAEVSDSVIPQSNHEAKGQKPKEPPLKQVRVVIEQTPVKKTTFFDVLTQGKNNSEIWGTLSLEDQQIILLLDKKGQAAKDITIHRLSRIHQKPEKEMESYINQLVIKLHSQLSSSI